MRVSVCVAFSILSSHIIVMHFSLTEISVCALGCVYIHTLCVHICVRCQRMKRMWGVCGDGYDFHACMASVSASALVFSELGECCNNYQQ